MMVRFSPVAPTSSPSPPPPHPSASLTANGGSGSQSPRAPPPTLVSTPSELVEDAIARRDVWRRMNVPQADPRLTTPSSSSPIAGIHGDVHGGNSPSLFSHHDFPHLKDASRHNSKKTRKFGSSFDSDDWNFKYTTRKKEFPFDEIDGEALKIKFAPIRLCWPAHEQGRVEEQRSPRVVDSKLSKGGQFRKEKWFRLPPKVRVVPGILGAHPSQVTRGIHQDTGEREVDDDPESGHHLRVLILDRSG
jgi:hypothetical protein